jgi:hypothetical protein
MICSGKTVPGLTEFSVSSVHGTMCLFVHVLTRGWGPLLSHFAMIGSGKTGPGLTEFSVSSVHGTMCMSKIGDGDHFYHILS